MLPATLRASTTSTIATINPRHLLIQFRLVLQPDRLTHLVAELSPALSSAAPQSIITWLVPRCCGLSPSTLPRLPWAQLMVRAPAPAASRALPSVHLFSKSGAWPVFTVQSGNSRREPRRE